MTSTTPQRAAPDDLSSEYVTPENIAAYRSVWGVETAQALGDVVAIRNHLGEAYNGIHDRGWAEQAEYSSLLDEIEGAIASLDLILHPTGDAIVDWVYARDGGESGGHDDR